MAYYRQVEQYAAVAFPANRPQEELYDLANDPHEINNLARDPKHAAMLKTMRGQLDQWMQKTGDHGRRPEPAQMYDSDMALYLDKVKRKGDAAHLKTLQDNIAQIKRWAKEGK